LRPSQEMHICAKRELLALQKLRHSSIISLRDSFKHKQNTYLVFEYMESDLEKLIGARQTRLPEGAAKAHMAALLGALEHCHANSLLHRDVKPNNVLIAPDGTAKLSDFGLARFLEPDSPSGPALTLQISHTWYKPPELLLGNKHYGAEVDVWAAGCVFAELISRKVLFKGSSELDQLQQIFELLGTPSEGCYKDLPLHDCMLMFKESPGKPLSSAFAGCELASGDALDLLSRMLHLDPRQRISAAEALEHRYFRCGEPPSAPGDLPKPCEWSAGADGDPAADCEAEPRVTPADALEILQSDGSLDDSARAHSKRAALESPGSAGKSPFNLRSTGISGCQLGKRKLEYP